MSRTKSSQRNRRSKAKHADQFKTRFSWPAPNAEGVDEATWKCKHSNYVPLIEFDNVRGSGRALSEDEIVKSFNLDCSRELPVGRNEPVLIVTLAEYMKALRNEAYAEIIGLDQFRSRGGGWHAENASPGRVVMFQRSSSPALFGDSEADFETPLLSRNLKQDTASVQSLWGVTAEVIRSAIDDSLNADTEPVWLDDPTLILDKLESSDLTDYEMRVAMAHTESVAFRGAELERLLRVYDRTIEQARFTEDEEEITAVCSAIRKYAMNMGPDRFSHYANWLIPSTSERVHQDVELELAKGVYWHLRYATPSANDTLRELQTVLAEVANDYLKPRLMLDKNYASIAKFAIIACLLIDARLRENDVSRQIWAQIAKLSMNWFDRLVKFESGKAVKSIMKRDEAFAAEVNGLLESLDSQEG